MSKKAAKMAAAASGKNPRAALGGNSGISPKELKSFVDRIENLEEEKKGLSDDIKESYTAAKEKDYDPKVIKRLVADRRKDKEELRAFKDKLERYAFALDPELADVLS